MTRYASLEREELMKRLVTQLGLVILATAGCNDKSKETVKTTGVKDNALQIIAGSILTESEKSGLLAAKEELFTRLSGRLMNAMSTNGPAAAIEVCQVEAKSIAEEVGKGANVKIGRTGVRLRNTTNQPPSWALKLVADRTDTPVFAKLSDERSVALLPIKLQAQCLMCHGPSEQISSDVKEKLTELYPQDQATGFSEGELRGWFWVESLN
jgi:hypothetical protein